MGYNKIYFGQILEGWRNHLFPPAVIKSVIEKASSERMEICRQCRHNSDNLSSEGYTTLRPDTHCTYCGCTLEPKTKCLSCTCPINKWAALATEAEDEELQKAA